MKANRRHIGVSLLFWDSKLEFRASLCHLGGLMGILYSISNYMAEMVGRCQYPQSESTDWIVPRSLRYAVNIWSLSERGSYMVLL
jgi:hypothetical protein